MGDLSKNFSRWEFICTGSNCCSHSSPVDRVLVMALQVLRIRVGVPMHVTSGFRCVTYNRSIGSQDDSQHPLGLAADIAIPHGYTVDQFAEVAETISGFANGGIGRYYTKQFVHLDVRLDGPARWVEA